MRFLEPRKFFHMVYARVYLYEIHAYLQIGCYRQSQVKGALDHIKAKVNPGIINPVDRIRIKYNLLEPRSDNAFINSNIRRSSIVAQ